MDGPPRQPDADTPRGGDTHTGRVGRIELIISNLLRGGIVVSLGLVLLGVIVMYVHHPDYLSSSEPLAHLKSEAYEFPTTIADIITGVAAGQGRSIILLGVLVLFLTPVLRVVASLIAFAIEKNWRYVLITGLVLTFLLLSLLLGHTA